MMDQAIDYHDFHEQFKITTFTGHSTLGKG